MKLTLAQELSCESEKALLLMPATPATCVPEAGALELEEEEAEAKAPVPLPSLGSALHGSGDCRPCAWFWKPQGCHNGEACRRCHLCPEGELKRRKKALKQVSVSSDDCTSPEEVPTSVSSSTAVTPRVLAASFDSLAPSYSGVLSGQLDTFEARTFAAPIPPPPSEPALLDFSHDDGVPPPPAWCAASLPCDEMASSEPWPKQAMVEDALQPPPGLVLAAPPPPPSAPPRMVAASQEFQKAFPSVGSAFHEGGTCIPCAWFWKAQGCQNGADCGRCHLCPPGEVKERKKAKAAVLRAQKAAASQLSTALTAQGSADTMQSAAIHPF